MSVSPLVSVIIPSHNAARWLSRTLGSVLRQTHENFEAIVIDDASTDETAVIAARLAAADARIVLMQNQKNLGVAATRNLGLRSARGDLVAPLDADDLWHPHKLARQLRRLGEAGDRAGVVYCWSADIDSADDVIGRRLDLDRYEGDVYAPLVVSNFLGNSSVPLIRKELLLAAGGWDESLRQRGGQGCEDWHLYLQLAERCDFVLEPAFLVGYRQSAGAMSRDISQMRRSYRLVLEEAMRAHPELPPPVFRWSRSAFDHYMAETLQERGFRLRGLLFLAKAALRDPTWVARASSRKKLRRWVRQFARPEQETLRRAPLQFSEASPEPGSEIGEGRLIAKRRLRLGAIRISSMPA
jgi:glycosyltransferase involved in cell wall biosynthesis